MQQMSCLRFTCARFSYVIILTMFGVLLPSCVHVEPVNSVEQGLTYQQHEGELVKIDRENVARLYKAEVKLERPLVLEYTAQWCKPCKYLQGYLSRFASQDRDKANFALYDITDEMQQAAEVGFKGITPQVVVFYPHGKHFTFFGAHVDAIRTIINETEDPWRHELRMAAHMPKNYSYFLIGGSPDINEFGKEAFLHAQLLVEKGADGSKVACYFQPPDISNFYVDHNDYLLLQKASKYCFKAEKKHILSDIKDAFNRGEKDVYVYMSSHGLKPEKQPGCHLSQQYLFSLSGQKICEAENFLTDRDLIDLLKYKSPETRLTMVIQACYSGGFLLDPRLQAIPNLRILTSSRHDRTSFGCSASENLTYFGKSYLQVISDKDLPQTWIWSDVVDNTKSLVNRLERSQRIKLTERSEPQSLETKRK